MMSQLAVALAEFKNDLKYNPRPKVMNTWGLNTDEPPPNSALNQCYLD